MPYPTKYTRQYDFQSYQVSNPTRPLPGNQVNVDLNAVVTSVDELVEFLKTSIRADGRLANGSVGVNQLDESFNLGFSLPTTWESGVDYTTDSTVLHDNKFWIANVDHTSTDGFDESKWDLIVDFGAEASAAAASATAAASSATAAAASATAADGSADAASDSATAASNSATAASGSATTATTQATNASTSATNAAASETNAAASATAADASADAAAASAASITIASQAEAEAGTDNTKVMSPLRTAEAIAALSVSALTIAPQGRITLASGVAVMTTSQSGVTTVRYTPFAGNMVPIYDGTNMTPTVFAELSQATTDTTKSPAAVAASKVYDLFVWDDGGTLRCTRGPAWTNDTTRGYTLTMVNGILLNTSAITNGPAASRGTWVGTIKSNASSTIDYILGASASGGTAAVLYVWNAYNQVQVCPSVIDNGATYTYSTNTIRQARASAGNQISYVVGAAGSAITVNYAAGVNTTGAVSAYGRFGVGIDSTSSFAGVPHIVYAPTANAMVSTGGIAHQFQTALGAHVISANEISDGSNANTFNNLSLNNLSAAIWM